MATDGIEGLKQRDSLTAARACQKVVDLKAYVIISIEKISNYAIFGHGQKQIDEFEKIVELDSKRHKRLSMGIDGLTTN